MILWTGFLEMQVFHTKESADVATITVLLMKLITNFQVGLIIRRIEICAYPTGDASTFTFTKRRWSLKWMETFTIYNRKKMRGGRRFWVRWDCRSSAFGMKRLWKTCPLWWGMSADLLRDKFVHRVLRKRIRLSGGKCGFVRDLSKKRTANKIRAI